MFCQCFEKMFMHGYVICQRLGRDNFDVCRMKDGDEQWSQPFVSIATSDDMSTAKSQKFIDIDFDYFDFDQIKSKVQTTSWIKSKVQQTSWMIECCEGVSCKVLAHVPDIFEGLNCFPSFVTQARCPTSSMGIKLLTIQKNCRRGEWHTFLLAERSAVGNDIPQIELQHPEDEWSRWWTSMKFMSRHPFWIFWTSFWWSLFWHVSDGYWGQALMIPST